MENLNTELSRELIDSYRDLLEDIKEHKNNKADYNTFVIEKSIHINTNTAKNQCFDEICCEFLIGYYLVLECELDDKGFSLDTSLLRQWANEIKISSCELMLIELRSKIYDYLLTQENIELDTFASYIYISPIKDMNNVENHMIKLKF